MKTIKSLVGRLAFLWVLLVACAFTAQADGKTAGQEKTWTGTLTAVDAHNRTVKAESYFTHRSFTLGDDCKFTLGDHSLSLADLRPGQKVEIAFQNADGVLVADRISQEKLMMRGKIVAMDPLRRELTLRDHGRRTTFMMSEDGTVSLNNDRRGTFNDLKLGGFVTITYEIPHNQLVARDIDQQSRTFVGTLNAINLENQTLLAREGTSDRKFTLAPDCSIVMNGSLDAGMNTLQPGRQYELDYDRVNGVNVVTRIAPAPAAPGPEVSTTEVTYGIPAH